MPNPLLVHLPVEIIRAICGHLPPDSALTFLLVCRQIYRDCDDLAVWRDVVDHGHEYPFGIPSIKKSNHDEWKRYVIAGIRASRGHWSANDCVNWLPQVIALGHSSVLTKDFSSLQSVCEPVFEAKMFAQDTDTRSNQFQSDVKSPFDIHTWRRTQAGSFCLSMRLLSLPAPSEPPESLRGVQWFSPIGPEKRTVSAEHQDKLLAMHHALANRAAGFLAMGIRHALTHRGTLSRTTVGLLPPPTATTIPLSRLMRHPPLFCPDSVEQFCKCHLASMTDPSFFVNSEWTGYISYGGFPHIAYGGIGGEYKDTCFDQSTGYWSGPGLLSHGRYFDRVVRFRLAESYDADRYRLQSNNFFSEAEFHNLTVTVERSTGRLTIAHWHRISPALIISHAVMTPFGILCGIIPAGYWMWLWKVEWSECQKPFTE